jgi:WhiB family transcriptional regulator, redox-sensing transcriptional regulator
MTAVFAAPARVRILRPAALDWHRRAACQYSDPELFFPEQGAVTAEAKALCRACPVREECLLAAITAPSAEYGIWGGFAERARRLIARRYRTGTPLAGIIAEDDERFYARAENPSARLRKAAA